MDVGLTGVELLTGFTDPMPLFMEQELALAQVHSSEVDCGGTMVEGLAENTQTGADIVPPVPPFVPVSPVVVVPVVGGVLVHPDSEGAVALHVPSHRMAPELVMLPHELLLVQEVPALATHVPGAPGLMVNPTEAAEEMPDELLHVRVNM